MKIENEIAIVSGGASGMGAATVKMLNNAGAKVAILDLNKPAFDFDGITIACDITETNQIENAFKQITESLGSPRICVNCAGIVMSRRMVGKEGPLPLDEFSRVIKINLIGTFNVMRMATSIMTKLSPLNDNQRGIVINTASVAAFEGQIGQTAYSASKGGIVSMTLPAAREMAQFGIRVMTIAPGLVDTPMFEKIPTEARLALTNMVPFPKRLAYPQEFAKLVLQIIDNDMLNGEVIRLDGALRMQP